MTPNDHQPPIGFAFASAVLLIVGLNLYASVLFTPFRQHPALYCGKDLDEPGKRQLAEHLQAWMYQRIAYCEQPRSRQRHVPPLFDARPTPVPVSNTSVEP